MKENSISYKTAKQEVERLIEKIEKCTITHRTFTAECLRRVLKENEEWQKAYQEEKDKQFELIRENQELKDKYAAFVKMSSEVIANSILVQKVEDLKQSSEDLIDASQGCMSEEDLLQEHGKIKAYEELLEGRK